VAIRSFETDEPSRLAGGTRRPRATCRREDSHVGSFGTLALENDPGETKSLRRPMGARVRIRTAHRRPGRRAPHFAYTNRWV